MKGFTDLEGQLIVACQLLLQEAIDQHINSADVALGSSPGMDKARSALRRAAQQWALHDTVKDPVEFAKIIGTFAP